MLCKYPGVDWEVVEALRSGKSFETVLRTFARKCPFSSALGGVLIKNGRWYRQCIHKDGPEWCVFSIC